MGDYRICHNTAPHQGDWWTVEKLTRGWFGRWRWQVVKDVCFTTAGPERWPRTFSSRDDALEWIAEDRKPRTHVCEEV